MRPQVITAGQTCPIQTLPPGQEIIFLNHQVAVDQSAQTLLGGSHSNNIPSIIRKELGSLFSALYFTNFSMTNRLTILTLILIGGSLPVLFLFIASQTLNRHDNNFLRVFPPDLVQHKSTLDLAFNSFYIAGVSSSNVYLGNPTNPYKILVTDNKLTHTQVIDIKDNTHFFKSSRLEVDSPNFYLMDGVTPFILKGSLTDTETLYRYNSIYFVDVVHIPQSAFVMRSYYPEVQKYILAKQNTDTPVTIKNAFDLPEKQIDGMLCTDGMLHFSKAMSRVVYVYYYRNRFDNIDTTLTLLSQGKTIDTVSHANIKVGYIKERGQTEVTMAAPPMLVNKHSCVSGDLLFIHSSLKADNEENKIFEQSSVIDAYSLVDNTYQFSFYVPNFKNKKLKDFRISGNNVFVLTDRYVQVYTLKFINVGKNDTITF